MGNKNFLVNRILVITITVFLMSSAHAQNKPASPAEKPNIVVVFMDNFGWGELGCYGGGILRGAPTPRIDKLPGEGTRLLNFNTEASCTPSRPALITGVNFAIKLNQNKKTKS